MAPSNHRFYFQCFSSFFVNLGLTDYQLVPSFFLSKSIHMYIIMGENTISKDD